MNDTFLDPDPIYRGTDFWMLNGLLDEAELARQIDAMHEQGVHSFIARTYIGLRSDYPGLDFHGKTAFIIAKAREHGMTVFLQAGYMPEAVVGLPREHALEYLVAVARGGAEAGDVLVKNQGGHDVVVRNSGTFLNMFNEAAVKFYIAESYEKMWREFADDFGKTVRSIWVDEPSYNAAYLPWSPDLAGIFRQRFGYDLFDKVDLLFLDGEGAEKVRHDYRTLMEDRLGDCYFAQIRDWCNRNSLWFSGHLMHEDTLASQISRSCATMPYYRYFDIPGIDMLTAAMNWRDDALRDAGPVHRRRFMEVNTPLQCCSAARQHGKSRVLAEMYGVSSQGLTFRDMRHMFDHFAAFGINHRSVHGMFYSLLGRRKRAYPPHVNDYQPYFRKYRMVTDYVARASFFISQGEPVRDTLVVHPLDSAYLLYRGTIDSVASDNPELEHLDNLFHDTLIKLLHGKIEFDLGDEASIRDFGKVENGAFAIGMMAYRTVVLPHLRTLRQSTLDRLVAFARQGGSILVLGAAPDRLDGAPCATLRETLGALPGIRFAEDADDALRTLDAIAEAGRDAAFAFVGDASPVLINHRRDAKADYFFLVNEDCSRAIRGSLGFKGDRRFRVHDGRDGSSVDCPSYRKEGRAWADFSLPEGGSAMISAERVDRDLTHALRVQTRACPVLDLDGPWDFHKCGPNALLLEFCRFRKGLEPFSPLYPVLAVHEKLVREDYRGPLTLAFAFEADVPLTGLRLALEKAEEHRIVFNGSGVDSTPTDHYLCRDFQVVGLPDVSVQGSNTLEITREFKPLQKFKSAITSLFENLDGTELENLYLLGDFACKSRVEFSWTGSTRLSRRFRLGPEPDAVQGDITVAGYPFYAGTVAFRKRFKLDPALVGGKATLVIGEFHGCVAEIAVNGRHAGDMAWLPHEVDVGGLLVPGDNEIAIRLTNTLRNLLGPYHRTVGEIGEVWGDYSTPNKPWLGTDASCREVDWQDHRDADTRLWSDSYFAVKFGFARPALRFP